MQDFERKQTTGSLLSRLFAWLSPDRSRPRMSSLGGGGQKLQRIEDVLASAGREPSAPD